MKSKQLYIFGLILCGIFAFSLSKARIHKSSQPKNWDIVAVNAPSNNSSNQHTGDSPFIRFHHGIDESGVSVVAQNDFIVSLNPVNSIPEKFAGINSYLSGLDDRLPVTWEIFCATPLRSPPFFC